MPLKGQCGQWVAVALDNDLLPIAVPLSCKSWDCPKCAPRLKRRLLSRLRTTTPSLFVTLTTSHRTAPTAAAAFPIASAAFSLLVKRWRRKFPSARIEYVLVWEKTKAGWPHIHALLEAPLVSKHWLSHTWNELTGSFVVDLQTVNSKTHAITYIAKYLTKDPAVPPGFRRWRRSAGMFRHHKPPLHHQLPRLTSWRLIHRSEAAFRATLILHGFEALQYKTGLIHGRDSPEKALEQLSSPAFTNLLESLSPREQLTVWDWPLHALVKPKTPPKAG